MEADRLRQVLHASPVPAPLPHRCGTCAKRFKNGDEVCRVLVEPIGLTGGCWAWSDDPHWNRKADKAARAYGISSHYPSQP